MKAIRVEGSPVVGPIPHGVSRSKVLPATSKTSGLRLSERSEERVEASGQQTRDERGRARCGQPVKRRNVFLPPGRHSDMDYAVRPIDDDAALRRRGNDLAGIARMRPLAQEDTVHESPWRPGGESWLPACFGPRSSLSETSHAVIRAETFIRFARSVVAFSLQSFFESQVEGSPRILVSAAHDVVIRIVREALVNAFRHANAQQVDARIRYADDCFAVQVRDDGDGIDPEILRDGRSGHMGLPVMRERAQEIGAKLDIESSAGGTRVELLLPARRSYRRNLRAGLRDLVRHPLGKRASGCKPS